MQSNRINNSSYLSSGIHWIEDNPRKILILLGILINSIIFYDFIFGNKLYVFGKNMVDSADFTYPHLMHAIRYLKTQSYPGYSFYIGLGQGYYPFYSLYLSSLIPPLALLTDAVNPTSLPGIIVYREAIKLILAAWLFFEFLSLTGIKPLPAIIGGILFGFSGHLLISSPIELFTSEAVLVAMMLYGMELVLQRRAPWVFMFAIVFMGLLSPFSWYNWGLLALGVLPFRFYAQYRFDWNKLSRIILTLGGVAFIGALLSAVFSGSVIELMLNSPRVGGDATYFNHLFSRFFAIESPKFYVSALYRMYGNELLGGSTTEFMGWFNYFESPWFYCGIFTLLLIPQSFRKANGKWSISNLIIFLIVVSHIFIPGLRYLFWGFAGDYFRSSSLCLIAAFIYLAMNGFSNILEGNKIWKLGIGATALFIVFTLSPLFPAANNLIPELRWGVMALVIIYLSLLILLIYRPQWSLFLILIVIVLELGWQGKHTVNKDGVLTREILSQPLGYNDDTQLALQWMHQNDPGFYRIDKNYYSAYYSIKSYNDGIAQNYMNSSSYYSFNSLYYIRFLTMLGLADPKSDIGTRWSAGLDHRDLLLTLTAHRYKLTKDSISNPEYVRNYLPVQKTGKVTVWKNKNAIPFGVVLHQYIPKEHLLTFADTIKDQILLRAVLQEGLPDSIKKELKPYISGNNPEVFTDSIYTQVTNQLNQEGLRLIHQDQNNIEGILRAEGPGILLLPMTWDAGWKAFINGKEESVLVINEGLSGVYLPKGIQHIKMRYFPPNLKLYAYLSGIGCLLFFGLLFFWKRINTK